MNPSGTLARAALLGAALLLAAQPSRVSAAVPRPVLAQLVARALTTGVQARLSAEQAAEVGLNGVEALVRILGLPPSLGPGAAERYFMVAYNLRGRRREAAALLVWRVDSRSRGGEERSAEGTVFLARPDGRLVRAFRRRRVTGPLAGWRQTDTPLRVRVPEVSAEFQAELALWADGA
ncbi:MAG: hypothetical protein HY928_05825 [Elusimicrobia bacterium]|nr:hypothetical protein [Elusimicrobiota bacterium]